MVIEFCAEVWFWKGPAPWYFVSVPDEPSAEIRDVAAAVTYGWGMVPVKVRIGKTEWTTTLCPKDGCYVLPLKAAVRAAEGIEVGDTVKALLDIVGVPQSFR